ncbi:MAG: hypothetical protein AB7U73_18600 [Pirellulales bacterium]
MTDFDAPAEPPLPPRESAPDGRPPAGRGADLSAKRAAATGWLAERWVWLRPLVRQAWINLQVWLPFLQNRTERERMVKYHPREHREGTRWAVDLPKQCWQCGATETLWDRELELEVRAFEYPLQVLAGMLGAAGFFLFLAWAFGSWRMLLFYFLSLLVGGVVLWVKSWPETVKLQMWTCPQHAAEMRSPTMGIEEGELFLFMPSELLAEQARRDLRRARLERDSLLPGAPRSVPPAGGEAGAGSGPPARPAPPGPLFPELPPIKLAGDDE